MKRQPNTDEYKVCRVALAQAERSLKSLVKEYESSAVTIRAWVVKEQTALANTVPVDKDARLRNLERELKQAPGGMPFAALGGLPESSGTAAMLNGDETGGRVGLKKGKASLDIASK